VIAAALALTITAGITTSLSGCSIYGGIVNQQLSTEDNLANQRKFALEFIHKYRNPGLQSIQFTTEGYVNGAGDWIANAVLTIEAKQYKGSLGDLTGGGPLPKAPPGAKPGDVTVIYSDGTSEVLR
jgi:hypothetical protein